MSAEAILLNNLFQHITAWHIVAYVAATPFAFYILYGFEVAMNSGQLGRHPVWFPFQCFWQDIQWNILPGARQRRIEHMKAIIVGTGWWGGTPYEEIRDKNLYYEESKKIISLWYFLLVEVGLYLLLGPITLMALVILWMVGALIHLCLLPLRHLFS